MKILLLKKNRVMTSNRVYGVHQNIAILSGTGSALALIGTGTYFMSFEYVDPTRVDVGHRDMVKDWS